MLLPIFLLAVAARPPSLPLLSRAAALQVRPIMTAREGVKRVQTPRMDSADAQADRARDPSSGAISRRAVGAAAAAAALPWRAWAAGSVTDLGRLTKGLDGINLLLDNWERETTDPISGAQAPDRVRFFFGLRTTDHPLFQVEKLLGKAQDTLPDDVDFDEWIRVVEGYSSHVNKVNELAYTSSFGEYNPGGGKEQIARYLELAREEVVLSRDSLKTIIKLLNI
jgi:Ca2+ transporting ATPase